MVLIDTVLKVEARALVESFNMGLLRAKLTLESTGHTPFTLELYKEDRASNQLWVPRAIVSKSGVPVVQNPEWYLEHGSNTGKFKSNIVLRENQIPIVKNYLSAINSYAPYGGVIEAKVGTGKTNMAIDIASKLQLKTLIIVPTVTLLNQWKDRILEFTDCKEEDIGIIQQDKCQVEGKTFVIGMLHSLAMKEYEKDVYNSFGFIVVDEVHRTASEVLSKAIFKFNSLYTCSLSATPDRKDGMANAFFWSLGPIVSKSSKQAAIPTIHILPYDGEDTNADGCIGRYGKFKGKLISSKYLNKMELSKPRIEFIGDIIKKLYEEGHTILAMSARISILENLKRYLVYNGVDETEIGLIAGKNSEFGRKIELGTYGRCSLGYDNKNIDAVVFVTPIADVRQAIGRLRKDGLVIDVVDTQSSEIKGWSYKRLRYYNSIKSKIINKAV
jgi:superfamily II DNA or RNA helicase